MIDNRNRIDQVDAVEARILADTAATVALTLTYQVQEHETQRGERLTQANASLNLAISWLTYAAMHEADEHLEDTRAAQEQPATHHQVPESNRLSCVPDEPGHGTAQENGI